MLVDPPAREVAVKGLADRASSVSQYLSPHLRPALCGILFDECTLNQREIKFHVFCRAEHSCAAQQNLENRADLVPCDIGGARLYCGTSHFHLRGPSLWLWLWAFGCYQKVSEQGQALVGWVRSPDY
jgi:hypothetical protein